VDKRRVSGVSDIQKSEVEAAVETLPLARTMLHRMHLVLSAT